VCYYGAGLIGVIIAVLTGLTLTEPERKTIGEETANDGKQVSIWKVILQPRIILLCLAASVRHCGKGANTLTQTDWDHGGRGEGGGEAGYTSATRSSFR